MWEVHIQGSYGCELRVFITDLCHFPFMFQDYPDRVGILWVDCFT